MRAQESVILLLENEVTRRSSNQRKFERGPVSISRRTSHSGSLHAKHSFTTIEFGILHSA